MSYNANRHQPLQLCLSRQTIRQFYAFVCLANAIFIIITVASDLGFSFTRHRMVLQFDLKAEGNIAAWYSSTLLLLTGLAAFAISAHVQSQAAGPSWNFRAVWIAAALFFVGLSVDETAQIHEWLGGVFTHHLGNMPGLTDGTEGVFAWLVALSPLIVAFFVVMKVAARWLRVHDRSRSFALGGMTCWIGVLVAEYLESQLLRMNMGRSIQGAIEEGMEITGAALFLVSFLEFLRYTNRGPDSGA
jgi:hypothetical protein